MIVVAILWISGTLGGLPTNLDAKAPRVPVSSGAPNIILIMADDLGYGELGCYGQTKIKTPCIDSLASSGIRFTRHYSGSPVCAPSRCVLLTGLHTGHAYIRGNDEYPKGVDVWNDRSIEGQRPLLEDTFGLGPLFKNAGYRTGCFGKWGLGTYGTTGAPDLQGFDDFYGYLCQRQAHNFYPTHLWENGEKRLLKGNGGHGALSGAHYSHDLIANKALDFLRENSHRPFFLYVPFTIPHAAIQVPDDSLEAYSDTFEEVPYEGNKGYLPHPKPRAAYAAMVSRMDRDVGRIVGLVDELGLSENTLILFTSDNGPTYNGGSDSEFFSSTSGLRGLKGSVYEGGIRVPLIARWKGRIEEGTTSDHVSAFWDFLPTISQIIEETLPADLDGLSFLPTLLGEGEQRKHEELYWELEGRQALIAGDWKVVRPSKETTDLELYDLSMDPAESRDLGREFPEILSQMRRRLLDARMDSPVKYWNFPKVPTD